MTYKDLIDALVQDSGDTGTTYRTNAFRWLNFVRQEAAMRGTWKSAKDSEATFDTSAGNTTGIYVLAGDIESVSGDEMYNVTDDSVIRRDTENTLKSYDANSNENGPPVLWADAGVAATGETQIRFWPIPAEVFTIVYLGNKSLVDVTSADELDDIDAYFGAISSVGAMLSAGLRYYHDLNNNEDATGQVIVSERRFHKAIKTYASGTGADSVSSSRLEPVGRRSFYSRPIGRLDPSHYSNR